MEGDAWAQLATVARGVGEAAASVQVGMARVNAPEVQDQAVQNEMHKHEERQQEWWWGKETRLAGSLLYISREHERQARNRLSFSTPAPDSSSTAIGETMPDDDEEDEGGLSEELQAAREQRRREQMRRLRDRAAELEEQLFRRSELRSRQHALVAHLRLVPESLHSLFPAASHDEDSSGSRATARYRDQKVSTFLDTHAEMLQVERALEEIRQARLAQEAVTRELWESVHTKKDAWGSSLEENESPKSAEAKELREAEEENARLREIWQAMIVESGVNWAVDEELRNIIFRLQSPLSFLHPQDDVSL